MSRRRPPTVPALVLAVVAAVAVTACGSAADEAVYETVGPAAFHELAQSDDVVIVDIRTPEEYSGGHIADSVMIDFNDPSFRDRLGELDKAAHHLVYCRTGNRSAQAVPIFEELGLTRVTELDGGIVGWVEAGLPLSGA